MDRHVKKLSKRQSSSSFGGVDSSASTNVDSLETQIRYMNFNYAETSDVSTTGAESPITVIERQNDATALVTNTALTNQTQGTNILPSLFMQTFRDEEKKKKPEQIVHEEKSLAEMGFAPTITEIWEKIPLPTKPDLFKLMKYMIENYIKPNVKIRIGTVTYNCHLLVLQAYSNYFLSFTTDMIIELPESQVSQCAFAAIYYYMVVDSPLIQRAGVCELFKAATFLKINSLLNQIWSCFNDLSCLNEDHAFMLFLEAREVGGLDLIAKTMLSRIGKFFLTLVSTQEFLDLAVDDVCTLLSSNEITVNSEIEVFMSALHWLAYNWSNRDQYTVEVMKSIRFGLIPPWFLVILNKNTSCQHISRIVQHMEVKEMIFEGICYTGTQLCYAEKQKELEAFNDRYQLYEPMLRPMLCDVECKYHVMRRNSIEMNYVDYNMFLSYLELLQHKKKEYWQRLPIIND